MSNTPDLRTLLHEFDPLRDEPVLPATDAHVIRRAMLGAVRRESIALWPRALPVAALIVLMVAVGAMAGRRLAPREPALTPGAIVDTAPNYERRQVQFSTPGGTRIIWTIDPNFQMGVMP